MTQFKYFVGIDIASATFTACVRTSSLKVIAEPKEFSNLEDGYVSFLNWLEKHSNSVHETAICMENTGVYSEGLAYFLATTNYAVAIEPPLKIQKKSRFLVTRMIHRTA